MVKNVFITFRENWVLRTDRQIDQHKKKGAGKNITYPSPADVVKRRKYNVLHIKICLR